MLEDGVTGFIRDSDEELADTVGKLTHISRAGCRHYGRRTFDIRDMAMKYVYVSNNRQRT